VPKTNEVRKFFSKFIVEILLYNQRCLTLKPALGHPRSATVTRAIRAMRAARLALADLDRADRRTFGDQEFSILFNLECALHKFMFHVDGGAAPDVIPGQAPRRGRRSGGTGNLGLRALVIDLLFITNQVGGWLSLEKNAQKGTLVDAIRILAPYVPTGVVPKFLSFSTLQRIKTDQAKTAKEEARLDEEMAQETLRELQAIARAHRARVSDQ
jgi:hypothetical protein